LFAVITASRVLHTKIWGFFPIFSVDPLKLCQVGWGH